MAMKVVVVLVLGVVVIRFSCTKAFSFHNRSSLNFAYSDANFFSFFFQFAM